MARITQRIGFTRYEADEHYKLALDAYRKNRFDTAITHMDDAIILLPTKAEYYATRGFFYLEDDVKHKALADFEKALKINRLEMLAHYGRGVIAYQDGNMEEALAHFTDAYKAAPNRPETLYYMALVYHRQRNNAVAKQWMEQALGLFEAADDKRKSDAARWLKEIERALETQALPGPGKAL
ncbi:MAG: tetratricopeptide repeat protein [Anaerolineaceae bacterium]|nr:tetratricopeptide repeat protein [Anaerolineaceae bacterium]